MHALVISLPILDDLCTTTDYHIGWLAVGVLRPIFSLLLCSLLSMRLQIFHGNSHRLEGARVDALEGQIKGLLRGLVILTR